MMSLKTRRRTLSCILSAGALVALAAPGAASASVGEQCSGSNVAGQGSTLQKLAQIETWGPNFNKSANVLACAGLAGQGDLKKPEVTYTGTDSGPGMESWGTIKKTPNF